MDAQKKIRKYICKKPWSLWCGLALLCAAAILLIGGIIAFFSADTTTAPFSREDSQPGTMATLEVTGVSHWLYRTNHATYYAALDAVGNSYTLCLTEEQFADMGDQAWFYLTQAGETPGEYALTGCVQAVPEEVRAGLADTWGITPEEYDSQYGSLVLNCATTARREAAAPWTSPAAILGLIGLALFLWFLRTALTTRRCLARLEELGLTEAAAAQLSDLDSCKLLGDDRGKLTEDFLFGRETGMACAISDIAWVYRTEKSRLFVLPRSVLMAGTRHTGLRAAVNLKRFDRLGITDDVIQAVKKKNHAVLTGRTKENAAAFRKALKK